VTCDNKIHIIIIIIIKEGKRGFKEEMENQSNAWAVHKEYE